MEIPPRLNSSNRLPPVLGYYQFRCSKAIRESLYSGRILRQINHTFIYLIPKVINPESFSQFCPISLRSVIYKGLSKYLTDRLKKVMLSLVDSYQNAFFPRRLIGDSCLLHSLRTNVGTLLLQP